MYARFELPLEADGITPKVIAGSKGLMIARCAVGPISPALGDAELTSFAIWQRGLKVTVEVPVGTGAFRHLVPKAIRSTRKDENGVETVEYHPSLAGQKAIDKLRGAILYAWAANPAVRLADRIDITEILASTDHKPTELMIQPGVPVVPTPAPVTTHAPVPAPVSTSHK